MFAIIECVATLDMWMGNMLAERIMQLFLVIS